MKDSRAQFDMCGDKPPDEPPYRNWPNVYCSRLTGHRGHHTCLTSSDVSFEWPQSRSSQPTIQTEQERQQ